MASEMPEEPGRFRNFLEGGGGEALGSILTGLLAKGTGGDFNQGATGFSRGYGRADEMIRQRQMERIQMAQEAERHKAEMERAERQKVAARVDLKMKSYGVLQDMGAPLPMRIKSLEDIWPDLAGRPMTDDDKAILTVNDGQAASLFHKALTDGKIAIEDRMLANRLKPAYPEMAAEVERVWTAQQPKGVDERKRYTPEENEAFGFPPDEAKALSVMPKDAVERARAACIAEENDRIPKPSQPTADAKNLAAKKASYFPANPTQSTLYEPMSAAVLKVLAKSKPEDVDFPAKLYAELQTNMKMLEGTLSPEVVGEALRYVTSNMGAFATPVTKKGFLGGKKTKYIRPSPSDTLSVGKYRGVVKDVK